MIRNFKNSDMEQVLDVWLKTSIIAHNFIDENFWKSKLNDMRNIYIPSSETYVYDEDGIIKGFFSLSNDKLAAIFVLPEYQGQGIGKNLLLKAKSLRSSLSLTVYKKNTKSVEFYKKNGFKTKKEQIDNQSNQIELLMFT